jgi:hypothetical protein
MHAVPALDWDATATRAEHERLAPILYAVLRRGSAAPASVLDRLRLAWTAAARQHLLAGNQLRDILGALRRVGVAAIVLKGPAVASEYYADPALRPFTDLDLLVRRSDRERAIDVVMGLGYVHGSPGRSLAYELHHAPAAYFVAPGDTSRLPVDLHWEFVAHPGGSRATELAAEEIWSRAAPTLSWGDAARAPAAEDLLIYLAAHLAIHHALAGTLWQLDLALVLKRHAATLDWDAVGARAGRWCAAGAVYFALRAVEDQLGVAAPGPTMHRLRPGALQVALVDRLLRAGPELLSKLEHVVGLLMLDRPSDVTRMLLSGLVPLPSWVRSRYDRSVLAAYAVHYGRLLAALARAMRLRRSRERPR